MICSLNQITRNVISLEDPIYLGLQHALLALLINVNGIISAYINGKVNVVVNDSVNTNANTYR